MKTLARIGIGGAFLLLAGVAMVVGGAWWLLGYLGNAEIPAPSIQSPRAQARESKTPGSGFDLDAWTKAAEERAQQKYSIPNAVKGIVDFARDITRSQQRESR